MASLIQGIARARKWYDRIIEGEVASFQELADHESVTARYIQRVFRCVSLAPEIVEKIVAGRVAHVSLTAVADGVPADWVEQRRWVSPHTLDQ
jgi:hypothetical protein